jgi:hypothetical protein
MWIDDINLEAARPNKFRRYHHQRRGYYVMTFSFLNNTDDVRFWA